MAKTLKFTYEGKDYTLEFTRESVRAMENTGFVADDLLTKPMTLLPNLFAGAFYAHHKKVKRSEIDKIFDAMTDKTDLIPKLVEMYREPLATLTEEPEEGAGNVTWEANF